MNAAPLLSVENLGISFGGLKALEGFRLSLPSRGLYGLIGPNGAGKTTAFNLLTGIYRPSSGSLKLGSRDLLGLPPHKIAEAGIARTFQNVRLFGGLSVLDNVRLAAQLRWKQGLFRTLLNTPRNRTAERQIADRAKRMLALLGLDDRLDERAGSLPYGHQRHLEIARALATEPKVLLLDEPAAGLNPSEKRELASLIQSIRDRFNVAILLIDHDMPLVMEVCEWITVLDHGVVIAEGPPAAIQQNPKVIAAYLGEPI